MLRRFWLASLLFSTAAGAAIQSQPQPATAPAPIPAAQDVAFPGTIRLSVDATDTVRGIFQVVETIPVTPGALTLLFPQWIPGTHSPSGPIDNVDGFTFTANGKPLGWTRDPAQVFAFRLTVPEGATEIVVKFQYLSPTRKDQGRIVMTPDILNLQWNLVSLYPAGYFTRNIQVEPQVTLPSGWRYGTALDPKDPRQSGSIAFQPVSYETLIDSPIFAGRYFRQEQLAPGVRLNIVADTEQDLAATPDQLAAHKRLISQAIKLFGAQHYDHYDILLAVSARLSSIGLEHHRSSENGVKRGYFTKWDDRVTTRNILPHEYTHSWNGKYRRPADLWTPDYSVPMRDSLLWVYEGQTQFWGYVLQARSGIVSKEDTLGAYAVIAADYDARQGRLWRPLGDTTNDPIMAQRRPHPWLSYQRSEDYYNEGLLLWLDVDMRIRERTGNHKSLDDFARAFFGMNDRDWGVLTYDFDAVVKALDEVTPYDWASYLHDRIDTIQPHPPLDWIQRGGYRLAFTDQPTSFWTANEREREIVDLTYSLGMIIGKSDEVTQVLWNGPAFQAGFTIGTKLVALNGQEFDASDLKDAIKAAKGTNKPIELLIKQGDQFRTVSIPYYGGLRYPRLEKLSREASLLDKMLTPK